MGHYRSEMGLEDEDALAAKYHEERVARMAKNIEKDIKKRGIALVLAEAWADKYHTMTYDREPR